MNASDERTSLAFITMSVLAGGNAVAIRFSNRELDPLWGAGLRFLLAATLPLRTCPRAWHRDAARRADRCLAPGRQLGRDSDGRSCFGEGDRKSVLLEVPGLLWPCPRAWHREPALRDGLGRQSLVGNGPASRGSSSGLGRVLVALHSLTPAMEVLRLRRRLRRLRLGRRIVLGEPAGGLVVRVEARFALALAPLPDAPFGQPVPQALTSSFSFCASATSFWATCDGTSS
jgi:hypothetical protein